MGKATTNADGRTARRRRALLALSALVAAAAAAGGSLWASERESAARPAGGTFLPSSNGSRAVIWAVGDGADGGSSAVRLATRIIRGKPDRLLYLGDVYDYRSPAQFAARYGSVYGRLSAITAPTPGNHDTPMSAGYDEYWRRVRGRQPPSFYSLRAGGWQLLSLNSELESDAASSQLRWLSRRLRRPGTCQLAFWHRPRYSAGRKHGDQDDVAPLWKALRGHASIVVNGHEHDMQRFKPIDGITEFVSGAGGHELYELDRGDGRLAFGDDSGYGALRLTLSPGAARYAFISTSGRKLDAGTFRCRRR